MMIQYLSHGQGPIEGRTPDPYRRVGYVSRFIYSFQSHLSCEMQTRNKWRQQQQQQQQQKSPKQNTIAIRQSWKKTNKGNDETRIEKKKNKYKIQTKVTSENGRLGPFSLCSQYFFFQNLPDRFFESRSTTARKQTKKKQTNKTIGTKEKVNIFLFSFTLIFVVVVVASPCHVRLTEFERVSCEKKRRFLTHQIAAKSFHALFRSSSPISFSFFFIFC